MSLPDPAESAPAPAEGRRRGPGLPAVLLAVLGLVLLGRRLSGRSGLPPGAGAKAGAKAAGRVAGTAATWALRRGMTTAALGTMAVQAASPAVTGAAVAAGGLGHRGVNAAGSGARAALGRVSQVAEAAGGAAARRIDDVQHTWRSTMSKLTIALGLGVGYVLGARAGRERYETIKNVAGQLMARPEVQQAQEKIKDVVGDRMPGNTGTTTPGTYIDLNEGSDVGTHPERL